MIYEAVLRCCFLDGEKAQLRAFCCAVASSGTRVEQARVGLLTQSKDDESA